MRSSRALGHGGPQSSARRSASPGVASVMAAIIGGVSTAGSTSRRGRARTLLSFDQLLALDAASIAAYRDHNALCDAHPVARGHISRPSIPSAFSESLTALLGAALYGAGATVAYGRAASDLLVFSPSGCALTVEVKASGVSRFQELKERDLAADALVRVDFGSRYVNGRGPATFHHLPDPVRFAAPRRKLTLDLLAYSRRGMRRKDSRKWPTPKT